MHIYGLKKKKNEQSPVYRIFFMLSNTMQEGIPFSQAERYRRIISNDDTLEKELEKLKSYFLKRNYPFHKYW